MNTVATNKDQLLAAWREKAQALVIIKDEEAALRAQVVEAWSQETDPMKSGVENVPLWGGYTLKIEHKLNYTLDNANSYEKLHIALEKIAASIEGGNIIAERIVKWKGELSLTEYKQMPSALKAIIDSVLTITPASKSVKLVPPKGVAA